MKYGVKVTERWYEHQVESVIENGIVKIPRNVCIIDVACPVTNNLILKRNKKLCNYSELWPEIFIIEVIIGASGSNPKDIDRYLLEEARYFIQSENFTKNCNIRNCQYFEKSNFY